MPALDKNAALALVRRRHPEWNECQRHWRFLLDSLEGGNRYRYADYVIRPDEPWANASPIGVPTTGSLANLGGYDVATSVRTAIAPGLITDRNLVPHLSEMDPDNNELYALRLARTPVPKHLERVISRHLSRIYGREVEREACQSLMDWWLDVDGCGTSFDQWIQEVFDPQLMAVGHLDVLFDHPEMEDGQPIVRTRRDLKDSGLDGCVAKAILPENMVWWELSPNRSYIECLVMERPGHHIHFRHWTAEDSTLYDREGNCIKPPVPHPFGRVPIRRFFDRRKHRLRNTGQPRYELAAEYQKAIYNLQSEQTLCDIMQAAGVLQGPEDFVQEGKITVGPTNVLPMKRSNDNGSYQGWEFVEPPQAASVERRQHLIDFADAIDQHAALTKPAGTSGKGTVAQSGLSKSFDDQAGNDCLSSVATSLERIEGEICEMALMVLSDGKPSPADIESVRIVYPRQFDLATSEDLASSHDDVVGMIQNGSELPETTKEFAKRGIRVGLPGLPDDRLEELYREAEEAADRKQQERQQMMEGSGSTGDIDANSSDSPLTDQEIFFSSGEPS